MAKGGGFPGMGGANMQQLMRQAQKMQADMQRSQEDDAERRIVKAHSPVGSRTVEIVALVAEERIIFQHNEAMRKASEETERVMGKITGGMNFGF